MENHRLNLAWGTNELPELHPYWKKWLHQAQAHSIFQPSGFFGSQDLRRAIVDRYQSRYHLNELSEHQVTITNGGTEALYTAFQWIKKSNGCVIIQQPSWGYFKDALNLLEIPYFESYTKAATQLTFELEAVSFKGPKLFLLTHPSNPESHIFDKAYLSKLSDWVHASSDHYVLSDEIYDWYASAKEGYHSWTEIHGLQSSIIVEGYSKPTGLAAFRVGYFLCDPELTRELRAFHMHSTYGISSLSNAMALEAQKDEQEIRILLDEALKIRRSIVSAQWKASKELLELPDLGMYANLKFEGSEKELKALSKELLDNYELMVTPSFSFSRPTVGMRINLCRPKELLEEAISILSDQLRR
jgi:aspartate/methionine/tyrosine aminotransferase